MIVLVFEVFTVLTSDPVAEVKLPNSFGELSEGVGAGVFIVKVPCTPPIVTVTTVEFPAEAAVPVAVTVSPFTTLLGVTLPLLTLTAALSPSANPDIADEA